MTEDELLIILKDSKSFQRVINDKDNFSAIVKEFPDHTNDLINCILRNLENFKWVVNNRNDFFAIVKEFPDHASDFINCILESPENFKWVVNNRNDFFAIVKEFPDHASDFINCILESPENFKWVVNNRNDFSAIVKEFPDRAGDFINCILENPENFKWVVNNRNDFSAIVKEFPDRAGDFINCILENPENFKWVVNNRNGFSVIVKEFPDHAGDFINCILENPENFKLVVNNRNDFSAIVKEFPDHASDFINCILENPENFKWVANNRNGFSGLAQQYIQIQQENLKLPVIKELINNHIISENQILSLTEILNENQCANLHSTSVIDLLANKYISFEQALNLNADEKRNLEIDEIRELIHKGKISVYQAQHLSPVQRENLKLAVSKKLIDNYIIPASQILALTEAITDDQRINLESKIIEDLIAIKAITFNQALNLSVVQRRNLEFTELRELIHINANQILSLTEILNENQRANLHSTSVIDLLANKYISFEQALNLNADEKRNLELDEIRELIHKEKISVYQARHLSPVQRENLKLAVSKKLIDNYIIPASQILYLTEIITDAQLMNLGSEVVRYLLDTDAITIREALRLTPIKRENLETPQIRERLYKDVTIVYQVLPLTERLTDVQRMNLESEVVNYLLDIEEMTIHKALRLTPIQRVNLEFTEIRELLYKDVIIVDQILSLTERLTDIQLINLGSVPIQELIGDRFITFRQALDLTADQKRNLESAEIRALIYDEVISIDEARALTLNAYQALQNPITRNRLRNGEITMADIGAAPVINAAQSTHTASVHKSVSESATRLANRYQSQIYRLGLNKVVREAKVYVESISNISEKNKAAKRGFLRITAPHYSFTDPGSQVTMKELTVFTFKAVHDDVNRIGSLEDAQAQWVEGLYEIQRGYNLSNAGIDDKDIDHPICAAGTFNKLIEKLQGIHPDCQIQFITKEIASLKLPIVVHEEAIEYLKNSANPKTAKELAEFTQLIHQIKEDGIEMIWDSIKGSVLERMFDEFGGLYEDRNDDSFVSLIDAGQYTALDEKEIVPFKLGIVIREEATRYLETLANPKTTKEALESTRLIIQIKEKGIEVIWEDHIKNNVIDRLFDEFSNLYENKTDDALVSLVDTGKNIELGDLSDFEEQIKSSTGYQHYCHHKGLEDPPRTAKRNRREETSHYQTTSVSDILANSFWTEGSALNSNFEEQESEQQRVVDEPSAIVEYHH